MLWYSQLKLRRIQNLNHESSYVVTHKRAFVSSSSSHGFLFGDKKMARSKRETKVINGILYQKCNECCKWLEVTNENFHHRDKKEGTLQCKCKECCSKYRRKYHEINKKIENKKSRAWYRNNKEKSREIGQLYYLKNKEEINGKAKEYYQRNLDYITKLGEKYREENKEIIAKRHLEYRNSNKDKIKEYNESPVSFETHAHQLTIEENPKEGKDGKLMVKCTYCGKYFYPTAMEVHCRIRVLSDQLQGESRIYCSQGCKDACPIYNQKKWPKGYKPATSREVDPLIRQMCLARDNYTCQKCERTIEQTELHSHHIEGATQMPMLSNDVENTITLCKKCHKWVHKQKDCTYYDLRCKK